MRKATLRGLAIVVLFARAAPAAEPTGLQLFEQKIRPLLVKECYSCHAADAKKIKGGLLLDTRQGMLAGGDTGPAVVPGKPSQSLILKALRHDEIAMPPNNKLPDEVAADFERWIKLGAPDPRDGKISVKSSVNLEEGRKFWSFHPTKRHEAPAVKNHEWTRGDIDRFILAAMEAKRLTPSPDADRRTLIRRVTFDLIGLPPSTEEVTAFVADPAPIDEALTKVVDRLLLSPRFGERWGRHWLDLARYADSNGRDENLTFHEAFRYRDFVINSFNRDKPLNNFIVEQIAGDLLPIESQAQKDEALIGSGFLILGPKVLADRDQEKRRMDVIDEQIDTIGKSLMGLSIGCARCHDHKFDPIPQTDYFALAGIFQSTHTLDSFKLGNPIVSGWTVRPLGGATAEAQLAAVKEHQKSLTALADQIKKLKADLKLQEDKTTMRVPTKLVGITVDDKDARIVGMWKASVFTKPYVGEGYLHDDKTGKGEKSITFTPNLIKAGEYEVYLSYTPGTGRARNVPVTVRSADGEKTILVDQTATPKIDGMFKLLGKFKFEAGDKGSVTIANKGTEGHVIADAVRFVPVGKLDPKEMAMGVPEELRKEIGDLQTKLRDLEAKEADLKKKTPPSPKLVMAPREEAKITNARINIRGNPHQLGAEVPRGFLQVATLGEAPKINPAQSGRLELATWLTDPRNPLVARVFVNRVWYHLMGEGIVRTVDDFGAQGRRPTHPELLDELAERFKADGWSTKKLIRSIVLSRVYRQSSVHVTAKAKIDPENLLFWKANRRRLEAEVIRDSILSVSGKLNLTMGGSAVATLGERAVDNDSKGGVDSESNLRRSIYLPVIRNELPAAFEVFDFADPDVTTGRRDQTTVPTQSLYLLNSSFVMAQSRETALKLLRLKTDDERITLLYREGFGRDPVDDEKSLMSRFLAEYRSRFFKQKDVETEAWAAAARAVFGSTEFRFVE